MSEATVADGRDKKSIMRSLGEFVGHVVKASKSDPSKSSKRGQRVEVHRATEEKREGNMILRRTTIEEVEYDKNDDDESGKSS